MPNLWTRHGLKVCFESDCKNRGKRNALILCRGHIRFFPTTSPDMISWLSLSLRISAGIEVMCLFNHFNKMVFSIKPVESVFERKGNTEVFRDLFVSTWHISAFSYLVSVDLTGFLSILTCGWILQLYKHVISFLPFSKILILGRCNCSW